MANVGEWPRTAGGEVRGEEGTRLRDRRRSGDPRQRNSSPFGRNLHRHAKFEAAFVAAVPQTSGPGYPETSTDSRLKLP